MRIVLRVAAAPRESRSGQLGACYEAEVCVCAVVDPGWGRNTGSRHSGRTSADTGLERCTPVIAPIDRLIETHKAS